MNDAPTWYDPELDPPPRGKTLFLLTRWGGRCMGDWKDDVGFIGWFPIPSIPTTVRLKMA